MPKYFPCKTALVIIINKNLILGRKPCHQWASLICAVHILRGAGWQKSCMLQGQAQAWAHVQSWPWPRSCVHECQAEQGSRQCLGVRDVAMSQSSFLPRNDGFRASWKTESCTELWGLGSCSFLPPLPPCCFLSVSSMSPVVSQQGWGWM